MSASSHVTCSVRSPDRFSSRHISRRATVTGLHLYSHSFILIGQRWVQEGGACGGVGAWWQDPWRGARLPAPASPRHHGELVRPGGGGVIQVVRRGSGLEGSALSLVGGVRWVRRGQVRVVPPCWSGCHCCCHRDAKSAVGDRVVGGGVGEGSGCGRVVNTRVGEAGVGQ